MFNFLLRAALAPAMLAAAELSYQGPSLLFSEYSYGAGDANAGCEESNLYSTGEITAVTLIETESKRNAFCQTSVSNGPYGSTFEPMHIKHQSVACSADKAEFESHFCTDETCSDCTSPSNPFLSDFDYSVTADNVLVALRDPTTCVETKTTEGVLASVFAASTEEKHSEAYWTFFFKTACGEEWLNTVLGSGETTLVTAVLSSASSNLGSRGFKLLAFVVVVVAAAVV